MPSTFNCRRGKARSRAEHLITEASAAADALLRGCPQLRVLATSREPLRIAAEHHMFF
jgi:predicted ATPase